MNLRPAETKEKPFVPADEAELELWTRFACAALEGRQRAYVTVANDLVLDHRKLRASMKSQAYR